MPGIRLNDRDLNNPEGAVRKFRKICERANVLKRQRTLEFYEKPSARKRREVAAAKRRSQKKASRI